MILVTHLSNFEKVCGIQIIHDVRKELRRVPCVGLYVTQFITNQKPEVTMDQDLRPRNFIVKPVSPDSQLIFARLTSVRHDVESVVIMRWRSPAICQRLIRSLLRNS